MEEIQGLKSLLKKLETLPDDIRGPLVKAALDDSCKLVRDAAMENIYEQGLDDTGELKRKIAYRVEDDTGIVGASAPHAAYVELGTGLFAVNGNGRTDVPWYFPVDEEMLATHKSLQGMTLVYGKGGQMFIETSGQHPQPFLGPALTDNKKQIYAVFAMQIRNGLRRYAK